MKFKIGDTVKLTGKSKNVFPDIYKLSLIGRVSSINETNPILPYGVQFYKDGIVRFSVSCKEDELCFANLLSTIQEQYGYS